ncbi:MAG: hypothetical protein R2849_08775 [Thermomicrobiales bacterium]
MDFPLLDTKVRVPLLTQPVVRRQRLIEALERGVRNHRATVVAAPAGYGKTTLLADLAQSSEFAVAWVSLDNADNEIGRFLRYLFSAWERIFPDVADSRLAVLLSATMTDLTRYSQNSSILRTARPKLRC